MIMNFQARVQAELDKLSNLASPILVDIYFLVNSSDLVTKLDLLSSVSPFSAFALSSCVGCSTHSECHITSKVVWPLQSSSFSHKY
eukprot:g65506.t1